MFPSIKEQGEVASTRPDLEGYLQRVELDVY
jgi:hypothetical protein